MTNVGWFQFRVKVEKNPELGFSISGGVGGRGNPFRPDDNVSQNVIIPYSKNAIYSMICYFRRN